MIIVAEIGGNHMGRLNTALDLINEAKHAGANCVKFQTFSPEQMAAPGQIIKSGPWAGRGMVELYRETHTPREWHPMLFRYARELGLIPFSSVFHPDDVDFLETLGNPIYKISSFELTDTHLIRHAARTGKRLMMSVGMANCQDIANAVIAAGRANVTLLQCTSAYPATAKDANLRAMLTMGRAFSKSVGISDHSLTSTIPVAAAVMGATVIEKHLTLHRSDGGADSAFSLEPSEFAQMVRDVNDALDALGTGTIGPRPSEQAFMPFRRPPGGMRGV